MQATHEIRNCRIATFSQCPPTNHTELSNWVKQTQPNIHVDETPWSVKGTKEWLWVVANSEFCLFTAADTRSRAELSAILGTQYQGVIISDDFSVYNGYQAIAQQKCLAHLRRRGYRRSAFALFTR
jgi:transposase